MSPASQACVTTCSVPIPHSGLQEGMKDETTKPDLRAVLPHTLKGAWGNLPHPGGFLKKMMPHFPPCSWGAPASQQPSHSSPVYTNALFHRKHS